MKYKFLVIEEFKGVRNLTIDFDKIDNQKNKLDFLSIIGKNGSGKTTIFDAITYIFNGTDARGGKNVKTDYNNETKKNYSIELWLEHNNKYFYVQKKQTESGAFYLRLGEFNTYEESKIIYDDPKNKEVKPYKYTSIATFNDAIKTKFGYNNFYYESIPTFMLGDMDEIREQIINNPYFKFDYTLAFEKISKKYPNYPMEDIVNKLDRAGGSEISYEDKFIKTQLTDANRDVRNTKVLLDGLSQESGIRSFASYNYKSREQFMQNCQEHLKRLPKHEKDVFKGFIKLHTNFKDELAKTLMYERITAGHDIKDIEKRYQIIKHFDVDKKDELLSKAREEKIILDNYVKNDGANQLQSFKSMETPKLSQDQYDKISKLSYNDKLNKKYSHLLNDKNLESKIKRDKEIKKEISGIKIDHLLKGKKNDTTITLEESKKYKDNLAYHRSKLIKFNDIISKINEDIEFTLTPKNYKDYISVLFDRDGNYHIKIDINLKKYDNAISKLKTNMTQEDVDFVRRVMLAHRPIKTRVFITKSEFISLSDSVEVDFEYMAQQYDIKINDINISRLEKLEKEYNGLDLIDAKELYDSIENAKILKENEENIQYFKKYEDMKNKIKWIVKPTMTMKEINDIELFFKWNELLSVEKPKYTKEEIHDLEDGYAKLDMFYRTNQNLTKYESRVDQISKEKSIVRDLLRMKLKNVQGKINDIDPKLTIRLYSKKQTVNSFTETFDLMINLTPYKKASGAEKIRYGIRLNLLLQIMNKTNLPILVDESNNLDADIMEMFDDEYFKQNPSIEGKQIISIKPSSAKQNFKSILLYNKLDKFNSFDPTD